MPSERGPHCQDPTIVPEVPKYRIKRSKIKVANAFAADRGYNRDVAAVASLRQPQPIPSSEENVLFPDEFRIREKDDRPSRTDCPKRR